MSAQERYKVTSRIGPYLLTHALGRGTFSVVKLAIHDTTYEKFACKIIDKGLVRNRSVSLKGLQREVEAMKTLKHPNTVRLVDVLHSPEKVFIIMELVNGGELHAEIAQYGRLSERYARFFFQQLIHGLQHCHEHGVYHRDLKPENLLLEEDKTLKITDFGMSALHRASNSPSNADLVTEPSLFKTLCGTPLYAAPEIVCKSSYLGPKVDAWACGVILYALCTGAHPFESENDGVLFNLISQSDVEYPNFFSEDLVDLVGHLLAKNPAERYSLAEVREHPWFNGPVERVMSPQSFATTEPLIPISKNSTPVQDTAPYFPYPPTKDSPQGQNSVPLSPQLPSYQEPYAGGPTLSQKRVPEQPRPHSLQTVPYTPKLRAKSYPQALETVRYNAKPPPILRSPGKDSVPYDQLSTSNHIPVRRDVVRAGQGQAYLLSKCAHCQGSSTGLDSEYDHTEEVTRRVSPNHVRTDQNRRAVHKKSCSSGPICSYDDDDAEYLDMRKMGRDTWNNNSQESSRLGAADKPSLGGTLAAFSRSESSLQIPKLVRAGSHDGSTHSCTAQQWAQKRNNAASGEYVAGSRRSFVSRETGSHMFGRERLQGQDLYEDFQERSALKKGPQRPGGWSWKREPSIVRFKNLLDEELEDGKGIWHDGEWVQNHFGKMVWCRRMMDFDMIPDADEFGIDSSTLNNMWTAALGNENIRRRGSSIATPDVDEFGADSSTLNELWTAALSEENFGRRGSFPAKQLTSPVIPSTPHAGFQSFQMHVNGEHVLISEGGRISRSYGRSGRLNVELRSRHSAVE